MTRKTSGNAVVIMALNIYQQVLVTWANEHQIRIMYI